MFLTQRLHHDWLTVGPVRGESSSPVPPSAVAAFTASLKRSIASVSAASCISSKVDGVADGETRATLMGVLQLATVETVTGVLN